MNKWDVLLQLDTKKETDKIVRFIQKVFQKTVKKNVVIGWSGGIDSTVSLHLLTKSIGPQNIFVYHLPYIKSYWKELVGLAEKLQIPKLQAQEITIKKSVDEVGCAVKASERTRLGNIMARIRMIILFDQAKHHNALVCGTENRTEHLLGYFTRYGDAASDIEPITHLFKTQVYQLADYLQINQNIMKRTPSADLWEGQTDEGEFGFTYKEADEVLYRYIRLRSAFDGTSARQVDQSTILKKLEKEGKKNAKKIIERYELNKFKQEAPYVLY